MVASTASRGPVSRRRLAVLGLAGALLGAVGDGLLLGRPCSGRDFDRASGLVPPQVESDPRWTSLWNGADLPGRRRQVGTVTGLVGIGLLQGPALLGLSRTLPSGRGRAGAGGAAATFAVAGMLTHQGCATVVAAYRRAAEEAAEPGDARCRPVRPDTRLLAASAAAALTALVVLSVTRTVAAHRAGSSAIAEAATTPLPWVAAALLSCGRLPAPVGGYARPASINLGLVISFALTAATRRRR